MRVLILTPWYPDDRSPNHGVFIRNLAVALRSKHEVVVISSKIEYSSFGMLSATVVSGFYEKVEEHRISVRRSFPIYNQLNYFLVTTYLSLKISRKFNPDVVHGNIGYPGGIWSWLVSSLLGRPFLMTEHTRLTNNFRSRMHRWLTIFSMKRAAAVHTVSKLMASEITAIIQRPCSVIPNIILADEFKDVFPKPPARPVQLGFLGGMNTPVKGLDLLLKAITPLKQDYELHIAGTGKLMEQLQQLAAELGISSRCNFHGFVPHWEVPAFMAKLHFLVSASRYESFGMVIPEAMACGLPVVATRCGGPEDFVNSDNGVLVPAEDIEKLRVAVDWMMEHYGSFDPGKLKSFVVERFSPKIIEKETSAIYESIVRVG